MRYDLWQAQRYLGGAQTRHEALHWARVVAVKEEQPVTIKTPAGRLVRDVTPRGARNAQTRQQ